MYNVSEKFKKAIKERTREYNITGQLLLNNGETIEITDDMIAAGSLKINNQCVSGEELQLGSVYCAQLDCTLYSEIDRYSLYNGVCILVFHLLLDDGSYEDLSLGAYTIDSASRNDPKHVSFTAYDYMVEFEKDMAEVTNGTPYEILSYICQQVGVELGQTEEEINALTPSDDTGAPVAVSFPVSTNMRTYRDALANIAEFCACFATINNYGRLILKRYGETPVSTIDDKIRKSTSFADYICKYTAVDATINGKYYFVGDTDGLIFHLTENPFFLGLIEDQILLVLNNCLAALTPVIYCPSEISWIGDPSIELGDMIKFTGYNTGAEQEIFVVITNDTFTYKGTQELKGVGKNIRLATVSTKDQKDINSAKGDAEQAKVKVLTYRTSREITIGKDREQVASLKCVLTESAIPQFNAEFICEITKKGTITIEYEINGNTQTWQPKRLAQVGWFSFTEYNIFPSFDPNQVNTVNIYISSPDGAEGTILSGDAFCTISGSSLVASTKWDGTIQVEEKIKKSTENLSAIKTGTVTVEHTVSFISPTSKSLQETLKISDFLGISGYNKTGTVTVELIDAP